MGAKVYSMKIRKNYWQMKLPTLYNLHNAVVIQVAAKFFIEVENNHRPDQIRHPGNPANVLY